MRRKLGLTDIKVWIEVCVLLHFFYLLGNSKLLRLDKFCNAGYQALDCSIQQKKFVLFSTDGNQILGWKRCALFPSGESVFLGSEICTFHRWKLDIGSELKWINSADRNRISFRNLISIILVFHRWKSNWNMLTISIDGIG